MIVFWWLIGCLGSPKQQAIAPTDELTGDVVAEDDFGPGPSFSLTDQHGKSLSNTDLLGKVWVADFFFTSCQTICPALTAKMAALQTQFSTLTYVSFSVDPGTDTPLVLLAYAERFHAQPGWYFLTGPIEDVRRIVTDGFKQAMNTNEPTPGNPDSIIHGDRFVVVDKAGHLRGFPEAQSPELTDLLSRLR